MIEWRRHARTHSRTPTLLILAYSLTHINSTNTDVLTHSPLMIELRPGHSPPHVTIAACTVLGSHQMSSVALARTQPSASALLRDAACACVCLDAVQVPCRCRVDTVCMRAVCACCCARGSLRGRLGVVAQDASLDDLVRVEEVHPGELLRHRVLHRLLSAARPGRPHKVRVGVALPPGGLEWEWTS